MKKLILSIALALVLILPANAAIKPQPRVELDKYEMTVSSTDNVYIEGSISLARGQWITLHTSTDSLPINYIIVPDSNRAEDFKIKVPKIFLKEGINTFHVSSKALKNRVSASNFKTITIKVNTRTSSTKKSQTITASNKTMSVGQTINLNAKSSSGLKLKYSSNNQNATVDNSGKVIARKVGTTKITITQAGNTTYKSASKTIVITIKQKAAAKKSQTITAANKTVNVGKSISLKAKASSGLKLTYKSSNTKIASVSAKGVVKGVKAGKATITITQKGNSKFKAATKKITITVKKVAIKKSTVKKKSQTITASNKVVKIGKDVNLNAKASSGLKLTYKSSNPKVVRVNSKGVVRGLKNGKATITISQKGNSKYKAATKKIVVTSTLSGRVYQTKSSLGKLMYSSVTNNKTKLVYYTKQKIDPAPVMYTYVFSIKYTSSRYADNKPRLKEAQNHRGDYYYYSKINVTKPWLSWSWRELEDKKDGTYYKYEVQITYADTAQHNKFIDDKCKNIAKQYKTGSTKTRVNSICKWIAKNMDYKIYWNESLYPMLTTKKGKCTHYSLLFYKIAKDAGLEVRLVAGKAGGINKQKTWQGHMWCIVKNGKKWYYVDPTWADHGKSIDPKWLMKGTNDYFFKHTHKLNKSSQGLVNKYCILAK